MTVNREKIWRGGNRALERERYYQEKKGGGGVHEKEAKIFIFDDDCSSDFLPDRTVDTDGNAFMYYRKDERNGKDRSGRRECGNGTVFGDGGRRRG